MKILRGARLIRVTIPVSIDRGPREPRTASRTRGKIFDNLKIQQANWTREKTTE